MKRIEHLPAVVFCATLVLPCLTPRPEKFGRAGRADLAALLQRQSWTGPFDSADDAGFTLDANGFPLTRPALPAESSTCHPFSLGD